MRTGVNTIRVGIAWRLLATRARAVDVEVARRPDSCASVEVRAVTAAVEAWRESIMFSCCEKRNPRGGGVSWYDVKRAREEGA
jgi:hypothetical protein